MKTIIIREHETGCYLDSHRGHYINRDMILLAVEFGFIIDTFERFAIDRYDDWSVEDLVSNDIDLIGALHDLCDEALAWLNCGDNSGLDRPMKGQNNPPAIPEGYAWAWNEGDFGLYEIEED